MFCGKCGTEVQNNAMFCPNCGEKVSTASIPTDTERKSGTGVFSKSKNGKKVLISIQTLTVVTVLIITITSLVGGKGYTKTLDRFYKSIENEDVALMRSTLADYWIDYQLADYDSVTYLIDDVEEIIEDQLDDFDCGDSVKIHYTIKNAKRATKEDLIELKDNIYDWYAYYMYDEDEFNKSIKDAYVLSISIQVTGNEDSNVLTSKILIIKENGKWKIAVGGLDNSFYSNY